MVTTSSAKADGFLLEAKALPTPQDIISLLWRQGFYEPTYSVQPHIFDSKSRIGNTGSTFSRPAIYLLY
ncbi:MAG: hypothetical protein COW51_01860 [Candidatus Moranbacteria bacterium CG17_big_fil_post_rev_8_21_14_2_50_44_12]|nr:MAG: hypothetical protein COW51_01860 [Candidatus Moranbacteria bacterium CG17_big_fil_post_rev_8_21_14_2_50_44_12]